MIHADELYSWIDQSVDGPMPLLIVTEGWIEASEVLSGALNLIQKQANLRPLISFNMDVLIDQRAHRPTMTVIDGVVERLDWPKLELSVGSDAKDAPFLLLHGPEPDLYWRLFAEAVATATSGIGITTMYAIGAYPAPVPHTRPVRVSTTASRPELLAGRELTTGSIAVPAGIHAAVAEVLITYGIETVGLWAQVPYYVSTSRWPLASIALLANLSEVGDIDFDPTLLEASCSAASQTVEGLLDESPPLRKVVAELESRYDQLGELQMGTLPSGDELEEELQRYLRNLGSD